MCSCLSERKCWGLNFRWRQVREDKMSCLCLRSRRLSWIGWYRRSYSWSWHQLRWEWVTDFMLWMLYIWQKLYHDCAYWKKICVEYRIYLWYSDEVKRIYFLPGMRSGLFSPQSVEKCRTRCDYILFSLCCFKSIVNIPVSFRLHWLEEVWLSLLSYSSWKASLNRSKPTMFT